MTNKNQLVKEHNEFINEQVDFLVSLIMEAISILEKEFSLRNPLVED